MKNLISVLLISLVPTSIFAIGGFGLQLGQGSFSVSQLLYLLLEVLDYNLGKVHSV